MTQDVGQQLNELARLYELAQHEKEKDELLRHIAQVETELGPRREKGLEDGVVAFVRNVALRRVELEELLVKEGIPRAATRFGGWCINPCFGKNYIVVPYSALWKDELRLAMVEHNLVLIGMNVSDLGAARDKDKIHRLSAYGARHHDEKTQGLLSFLAGYPNLDTLSFTDSAIGDVGAEIIAHSTAHRQLRCLDIRCNIIGDAGARAIASSMHGLFYLDAAENYIRAEGIKVIAQCEGFGELTHLDLGRNNMGDAGAQAIANSRHMRRLTYLCLADCDIGAAGARALANSEHMAGLTHLDLSRNSIGDEGARAIAGSEHMRGLVYLDLDWNGIGAVGAQAIANSKHLGRLTHVHLAWNSIGDEGAQAIAESVHIERLIMLNLSYTGVRDSGAEDVAKHLHSGVLTIYSDSLTSGCKQTLKSLLGDRVEC